MLQAPLYLFTPETPPYDVLEVAERADLADAGLWLQRAAGSAVMLAAAIVLGIRLRAARPSQRRVLGPLYVYGIIAVLLVPLTPNVVQPLLDISALTGIVIQLVVLALVPVGFALSILRGGFARTAEVEELGAWLGTDAGGRPALGEALAEALGDAVDPPGILDLRRRVHRCRRQAGRPASGRGGPRCGGDRAWRAGSGGDRLRRLADPGARAGAQRAASRRPCNRPRAAHGKPARQQGALRESRGRIMEAGDRERRHVAQDLHDGLQTRLVMAAIEASLAGASTGSGRSRPPSLNCASWCRG